jgi:hypothetical protein
VGPIQQFLCKGRLAARIHAGADRKTIDGRAILLGQAWRCGAPKALARSSRSRIEQGAFGNSYSTSCVISFNVSDSGAPEAMNSGTDK